MMNKVFTTDDNVELLRSLGTLITCVETSELRKHASSNQITRNFLSEYKPDKDHFLIHVIGVGDYETYGFNRNADAFTKEANMKYHPTFVKHAKFYREHNHHSPDLAIGNVVASLYNADMGRVELAIHGHKKKASDVWEKLNNNANVSVSMSCTVPFDVDSITQKRSRSPMDYEPHMRLSPGQFQKEFNKYAFVFNPNPTFFDISEVGRPAERTAQTLNFFLNTNDEVLIKAASSNSVIPGAHLAQALGIITPEHLQQHTITGLTKQATLQKFQEAARTIKAPATENEQLFCKVATAYTFARTELTDDQISKLRTLQPRTLFTEMAKRAAVLPYFSFLAYALNQPVEQLQKDACAVKGFEMLPEVFEDMSECCMLDEDMFDGHEENFMCGLDSANNNDIQKLLDEVEEKYTVEPEKAKQRTIRISIELSPVPTKVKTAGADEAKARKYSQIYGLYKLAAAEQMQYTHHYKLDKQAFIRLLSQHNF